ncbi:helix-turn-helix domain-containing protein [Paraburkholderia tropica]|uniref:helix-turn-helix domain-containing protein n=1 Tax=Paraburkholderia tropica TaxID=92647 RepID=UPI003D2810C7
MTSPTRERTKRSDNSLAAQRATVLSMLRNAPRDTYRLRAAGISHPAARVRELIAHGYRIESSRITIADEFGFLHRGVAYYALASEPTTNSNVPYGC